MAQDSSGNHLSQQRDSATDQIVGWYSGWYYNIAVEECQTFGHREIGFQENAFLRLLLRFSYENGCMHTPSPNFVVAASPVGA